MPINQKTQTTLKYSAANIFTQVNGMVSRAENISSTLNGRFIHINAPPSVTAYDLGV